MDKILFDFDGAEWIVLLSIEHILNFKFYWIHYTKVENELRDTSSREENRIK